MNPFDDLHRKGLMPSNSKESSAPWRKFLGKFIVDHEIQSVLDVGCGDGSLAVHTNWWGASYTGVDCSIVACSMAAERFRKHQFMGSVVQSADFQGFADLAVVKDVLQHLPFITGDKLIRRLSGCRYILVVNDEPGQKVDIEAGQYRPVEYKAPEVFRWDKKVVRLVTNPA